MESVIIDLICADIRSLKEGQKQIGNEINELKERVENSKYPCGVQIEDALENKRMLDADAWIDKLQNIAHDASAPGQYADYCMHLISEIEAELRAQEDRQ